jgi:hypothetical protein
MVQGARGDLKVGGRGYHATRMCRGMDILRTWCSRQLTTSCLGILQKLQTLYNGNITGIKLCCTGVCVDDIGDWVVAAFVQAPKFEPEF